MSTSPTQQKLLRRSRSHRILGGVCGGLADYLGTNPLVIRVIFVLFAIVAGSSLLIYVLLWLLVPDETFDSPSRRTASSKTGVDIIAGDVLEASERLRGGQTGA